MPDISYSWLLWRLGIRSSHFILLFLLSPFEHRTERDIALEQHCKSLCQSLTSDHAVGQFRRLLSVVVKYRGHDGLRRYGVYFSRSTLCDWAKHTAELFKPLYSAHPMTSISTSVSALAECSGKRTETQSSTFQFSSRDFRRHQH